MEFTFDSNIVSDLHKEAYGFRPSASYFEMWNRIPDAEKQIEWDRLLERMSDSMDEEAHQAEAAKRFEQRVADVMELVASSNRADAIRFIAQAEGKDDEIEFYGYEALEFHFGLKFGYIKESSKATV